jgi:hypothetical protein
LFKAKSPLHRVVERLLRLFRLRKEKTMDTTSENGRTEKPRERKNIILIFVVIGLFFVGLFIWMASRYFLNYEPTRGPNSANTGSGQTGGSGSH